MTDSAPQWRDGAPVRLDPQERQTAREVVGFIVAGLGDDLQHAFGSPIEVHDTREDAEGQMVQMWAEGWDDHEVFELTRYSTRMRPMPDVPGGS